jgi:hypothetical protein
LKEEKAIDRIGLGVIVAAMAIAASASAQGGRNNCTPTVQRVLSDAGVPSSDVGDIAYIRERDEDRVIGYTAWIRLNSCPSGYVVIDLATSCYVAQTYTDGACRVKGIKQG